MGNMNTMQIAKEKREAIVFYRSYYEALRSLPPEDRLAVYDAVFAYALDDEETETAGIPFTVFTLIKPSLEASKRRAESGRKGGKANAKQTASKPKAIKNKKQEIKNEEQELKHKKRKRKKEEQETLVLSASADNCDKPQTAAFDTDNGCPFEKIKDLYHECCPSFPRLRSMEGERKKAAEVCWRRYPSLESFGEVFRLAEASSFLKGQTAFGSNAHGWQARHWQARHWRADFDWLMKGDNFTKVLEHKYDDRPAHDDNSDESDVPDEWPTWEDYLARLSSELSLDPSARENKQPS